MRLPFLRSKSADPAAAAAPPRRKPALPPAPGDDAAEVQAARTRARQRLVGALVLLGIGVLGFPVLFETQPRAVAMDTPIEIAPRDPGSRTAAGPVTSLRAEPPLATPPPADAGTEAPADPPAAAPPRTAAVPAASGVITAVASPAALPIPAPAAPLAMPAPASAAPPAPAPSASAGARFVVQVGAFVDARALREARQKVEALGLKTYTQVIDSDAGKRTRVRVGPFDTRAQAEAAAKKLKAAGLPANLLSL